MTVTLFERQGTRVQHAAYDYTFRKPSSVTLHVSSGASARDTLVWDGGTTVVAHRGSGLFSALKKKFGLHDPATTTIRGSSVDQLGFGEILAHASETPGKLEAHAAANVNGEPTEALALVPSSTTRSGGLTTREVVLLSKTTYLPVRVLGYVGKTLVRQIDFSHLTLQRTTCSRAGVDSAAMVRAWCRMVGDGWPTTGRAANEQTDVRAQLPGLEISRDGM